MIKTENKLSLKSDNSDLNLLCLPIDNFQTFADEFEGSEISLNNKRFDSQEQLILTIKEDLELALKTEVTIEISDEPRRIITHENSEKNFRKTINSDR